MMAQRRTFFAAMAGLMVVPKVTGAAGDGIAQGGVARLALRLARPVLLLVHRSARWLAHVTRPGSVA